MSIGFGYRNGDDFESITLLDKQELLDFLYPVGSVFFCYTDMSPAEIMGGSWTSLGNDRLIRIVNDTSRLLETGGSWSHKHLTTIGFDQHKGQTTNVEQYMWVDNGGFPNYGSEVLNAMVASYITGAATASARLGRFAYTQDNITELPYIMIRGWYRTA